MPVSSYSIDLQAIIPFVPTENPQLDHLVYEMMLAHFLAHDRHVRCPLIFAVELQLTIIPLGTAADDKGMAQGHL